MEHNNLFVCFLILDTTPQEVLKAHQVCCTLLFLKQHNISCDVLIPLTGTFITIDPLNQPLP